MKGNTKITLSFLSIAILILAYLLLPKINNTGTLNFEQPNYSVRRIPAPTITSDQNDNLLVISSQPPSNKIIISSVDFQSGGYIKIFNEEEEIGKSEIFTGIKDNFEITLVKETMESDTVQVILYDEQNTEVVSKEVAIITTAVVPGVILPKDLQ